MEPEPLKERSTRATIDPKLFAVLAILVVAWLVFITVVPPELKPGASDGTATVSFKGIAGSETILDKSISVEKGTNAFEAMQSVATVGYQDFGEMGVMVEAINGTKPGENEFWALYIDGEMAMVGISGITIEENTTIEWKTEAIESYTG